jgi:hypothetical protein
MTNKHQINNAILEIDKIIQLDISEIPPLEENQKLAAAIDLISKICQVSIDCVELIDANRNLSLPILIRSLYEHLTELALIDKYEKYYLYYVYDSQDYHKTILENTQSAQKRRRKNCDTLTKRIKDFEYANNNIMISITDDLDELYGQFYYELNIRNYEDFVLQNTSIDEDAEICLFFEYTRAHRISSYDEFCKIITVIGISIDKFKIKESKPKIIWANKYIKGKFSQIKVSEKLKVGFGFYDYNMLYSQYSAHAHPSGVALQHALYNEPLKQEANLALILSFMKYSHHFFCNIAYINNTAKIEAKKKEIDVLTQDYLK